MEWQQYYEVLPSAPHEAALSVRARSLQHLHALGLEAELLARIEEAFAQHFTTDAEPVVSVLVANHHHRPELIGEVRHFFIVAREQPDSAYQPARLELYLH